MYKSKIVKDHQRRVAFKGGRNFKIPPHGWNKDWKPAPQVPKNAAEIAAAAKKYGLLPADYKPDPQIGGDYPDVPLVGTHERSGYEQWDDRYWRRNWGEPIHKDFNMYVGERMDTSRLRVSVWKQCAAFFGFVGFFIGLLTLDLKYGPTPKLVAPQRPTPGVVHYTFERKDE